MRHPLFVDEKYLKACGFDPGKGVSLLPVSGSVASWHIDYKRYAGINASIVALNNSIAGIFAKYVYSRELGVDEMASRFLYYGFGTTITFLLADRLIRINQLLQYHAIDTIEVPLPVYKFNKDISFLDFYYKEVERNPVFNQWVIGNILSQHSVGLQTDAGTGNASDRSARSLRQVAAEKAYRLYYRVKAGLFINKIRRGKNSSRVPFFSFGYLSDIFKTSPIIDGTGSLLELPHYVPFWFRLSGREVAVASNRELVCEIAAAFKTFLYSQDEINRLPEYVYENLARLVISLQPNIVNRDLRKNAEWALSLFNELDNAYYLTDTTTSNPISCLYLFAARASGQRVIACQHSAWGGYFANGSLITENLILGAHYYITFGWSEPDKRLSYWECDSLILPSPLYSKMRTDALTACSGQKKLNKHRTKKILLCPGFLNRFPSIYNSSLRIDLIEYWRDIISDIIRSCIEFGFHVELKFYNSKFDDDFKPLKDFWLSIGTSEQVSEYKDHNARIRYILNSDEYDYEFVIWDLPAGGFSECITTFKRAIALSSPVLHEYYPEENHVIEELCEAGLLFANAQQLKRTLDKINTNPDWFDIPEVAKAKTHFSEKYALTDDKWEQGWQHFINQIQSGTFLKDG